MAYKHGVYVAEQPTSLPVPRESLTGLQVVIGTAPVHLAKQASAVANVPKLCYTFEEAKSALGYSDEWAKFTLCQSMQACFGVFGVGPVVFINVLDPANTAHKKENTEESCAVTAGQAIYEQAYVLLDTVVVKNSTTPLVLGKDYTLDYNDAGNVVITMISTTAKALSSVTVTSSSLNPTGVTATDIVGSVDASTGKETGLEALRQVYPTFGKTASIILAPGWSHDSVVAAAMQAKTEGINGCYSALCVVDLDASSSGATKYGGVAAQKTAQGVTSKNAVALWPKVKIGSKTYDYSAVYCAAMAYIDSQNDDIPNLSPSNKDLRITATVLADGTEVLLDQEQGNVVNAAGAVTAINADGFKAWGNNTAAYPDNTDPKDRWIGVRRFFIWRGNSFIASYFSKVDSPANRRLIDSIVDAENISGNSFVARDVCAGYRLEYRTEDNPTVNILDGKVKFRMHLAPYTPAEDIECVMEFDAETLTAVMGGA